MAGHWVATGRNNLVLANAAAEAGLPAQGIDSPPLALPISGSKFGEGLYVGSTVIAESGMNGSPF